MPPPTAQHLPPPAELKQRCRALAVLDAVLCEDWDGRYYSFDCAWAPDAGGVGTGGEQMASMRNGCGDEWFLHFSAHGAFFKAFWHEHHLREDPALVYAGIPAALVAQVSEAAFSTEDVTLGGWHNGSSWVLRGSYGPLAEEFERLTGPPRHYQKFAADYFEVDIPLSAIAHVFAGEPVTQNLLDLLGCERTLEELTPELRDMGYLSAQRG